jgi:curved DNA-binding protein CbpA
MSSDVVSKPGCDPYSVLGIDRQASEAEIKRAYFLLVRQYPPEREPEKFRDIRTAYEQLRDSDSRARLALFLLQPPPALPNRRRPSYDLSVHADDLLTLAMKLVQTPMQDDFCEPGMLSESPPGR